MRLIKASNKEQGKKKYGLYATVKDTVLILSQNLKSIINILTSLLYHKCAWITQWMELKIYSVTLL